MGDLINFRKIQAYIKRTRFWDFISVTEETERRQLLDAIKIISNRLELVNAEHIQACKREREQERADHKAMQEELMEVIKKWKFS